jgi:nicotinamide/nicotinate riboside kinase
MRSLVHTWSTTHPTPRICILDGFLLYPDSMSALQPHLDIKLFLRTTAAKALSRRAARSGYVTLEGFWEDPPGYVEKIVWPNYVRDHVFLFKDGDVEGEVDGGVAKERGIDYMHGTADEDMGRVLEWAVSVLMKNLPKLGGEDWVDGVAN